MRGDTARTLPPVRLLPLLILLTLLPADVAGAGWRAPVPGEVTRPFDLGADPFEAGQHRGADLAARPGAVVRAPCAGPVAFAGHAGSSGRVVTLRCGPWRVTHMPLASIAVRTRAAVARGEPLGTLAPSAGHAGLHLGVRRENARFGYTDPVRFLTPAGTPTAPPLGRAPRPAPPTRPPPRPPAIPRPKPVVAPRPIIAPRRITARRPAIAPRPIDAPRIVAPRPAVAPGDSNPGARAPFAPWPAWLGLALVLAGAGLRLRGRARTARGPARAAGTLARAEPTEGNPCRS